MAGDNFKSEGTAETPHAEFLGVCAGRNSLLEPVAVLTFRPQPDMSFVSVNFAITKEQAVRLRNDLNYLFATSEVLAHRDPPPEQPEETKPTRKPRKKKGQ